MPKNFDPRNRDHRVFEPTPEEIYKIAFELRKKRESSISGENNVIPVQKMREGYEIENTPGPND